MIDIINGSGTEDPSTQICWNHSLDFIEMSISSIGELR